MAISATLNANTMHVDPRALEEGIKTSEVFYYHADKEMTWRKVKQSEYLALPNPEEKRRFFFDHYDKLLRESSTPDIVEVRKLDEYFQILSRPRATFGLINRPVWYRLSIENSQRYQQDLEVVFSGYLFDVELFAFDESTLVHKARKSIHEPKILKKLPAGKSNLDINFPISMPPNSKLTLYLRAYSAVVPHDLNIRLLSQETWLLKESPIHRFHWIFVGSILMLILHNFVFFIMSRNVTNLYYVFWIGSTLALVSVVNGLHLDLIVEDACVYWPYLISLPLAITGISIVAFLRHFLQLSDYPKLDRVAKAALIYGYIVFIPYLVVDPKTFIHIGFAGIFIVTPIILGLVFVLAIQHKHHRAWLFLMAFIPYIVGSCLRTLMIQGIVPEIPMLRNIMEVGSFTEAFLLSFALGDKLRTLNIELSRYINEVEDIVAEKTQDIASIMANIKQGIFTVKSDFKIDEVYSQHLEDIVGASQIGNKDPLELIFKKSNLSPDARSRLHSAMKEAFGEEIFNFEINVSQFPKEIIFQGKYLALDWQAISNREGQTFKILVTVRDITQLRRLEEQSHRHEREMSILLEILQVERRDFPLFLSGAKTHLQTIRNLLKSSDTSTSNLIRDIFIHYHTLKGIARSFELSYIVDAVHTAESRCSRHSRIESDIEQKRFLNDLENVEAVVLEYENAVKEKLQFSDRSQAIDNDLASELLTQIEHLPREFQGRFSEARQKLLDAVYIAFDQLYDEVSRFATTAAEELKKPSPKINMPSESILLKHHCFQEIKNILVHLVNNSLAHGFSLSPEPESQLQDDIISIQIERLSNSVKLVYQDNGKGINRQFIQLKAQQQGLLEEGTFPSDQDLLEVLFKPGFSSADSLSHLAGRGIGMSAMKDIAEKIGATLNIHTTSSTNQAIYFAIHIRLARDHYIDRASRQISA